MANPRAEESNGEKQEQVISLTAADDVTNQAADALNRKLSKTILTPQFLDEINRLADIAASRALSASEADFLFRAVYGLVSENRKFKEARDGVIAELIHGYSKKAAFGLPPRRAK